MLCALCSGVFSPSPKTVVLSHGVFPLDPTFANHLYFSYSFESTASLIVCRAQFVYARARGGLREHTRFNRPRNLSWNVRRFHKDLLIDRLNTSLSTSNANCPFVGQVFYILASVAHSHRCLRAGARVNDRAEPHSLWGTKPTLPLTPISLVRRLDWPTFPVRPPPRPAV